MKFHHVNPDKRTRGYIMKELNGDIDSKEIYLSSRLNEEGPAKCPVILKEAVRKYDDSWLSGRSPAQNLLKTHEEKSEPKGGTTVARVPVPAPGTVSEGESDGLLRGARAVEGGIPGVEAYRGKEVVYPRGESRTMMVCEMPDKPSYNSSKDSAFLRDIYEAAEIIERWTPIQRGVYLIGLREREKLEGKNIYRNVIRMMLTDSKGRKEFVRLFREGKL